MFEGDPHWAELPVLAGPDPGPHDRPEQQHLLHLPQLLRHRGPEDRLPAGPQLHLKAYSPTVPPSTRCGTTATATSPGTRTWTRTRWRSLPSTPTTCRPPSPPASTAWRSTTTSSTPPPAGAAPPQAHRASSSMLARSRYAEISTNRYYYLHDLYSDF